MLWFRQTSQGLIILFTIYLWLAGLIFLRFDLSLLVLGYFFASWHPRFIFLTGWWVWCGCTSIESDAICDGFMVGWIRAVLFVFVNSIVWWSIKVPSSRRPAKTAGQESRVESSTQKHENLTRFSPNKVIPTQPHNPRFQQNDHTSYVWIGKNTMVIPWWSQGRGLPRLLRRLRSAQLSPDAALLGDALQRLPPGAVEAVERWPWWKLRPGC